MQEIARMIDGDAGSLDDRIRRVLGERRDLVVARFTYWYTGRPPVHEAVILRQPG